MLGATRLTISHLTFPGSTSFAFQRIRRDGRRRIVRGTARKRLGKRGLCFLASAEIGRSLGKRREKGGKHWEAL